VYRLKVHPILRRGAERLAEPDRHLRVIERSPFMIPVTALRGT
jgi:hypothetical protein